MEDLSFQYTTQPLENTIKCTLTHHPELAEKFTRD